MSRIRSLHPTLWTDEIFVSLSPHARLFLIGLWTESDDKGVFQWSPLKLKMRLLPADSIDAAQLLSEIEAAGCIRRYEIGGKAYGAVRNFGRFQRPKKPNDIYPAPIEIVEFCASGRVGSSNEGKPRRNQYGTGGEVSPQMEDGGDEPFTEVKGANADPDKVFWDNAKAFLGASKASKIGQWVKTYGRDAAAKAITEAQVNRAVDPVPYIESILRKGAAGTGFDRPC